eukprot:CAMPEP_0170142210 /NCGR_PEP_ID=MMETSP0033_2-20121228/7502_1 /TAXON_ID=195969 /ORGANISM="Dolichomastix tenuilepis, Strain CCMP3274" /LENGTH=45 /DNA_ID= /DNA_START= /DNA_END= /DNA_ORIENTATION=
MTSMSLRARNANTCYYVPDEDEFRVDMRTREGRNLFVAPAPAPAP